MKNFKTTLVAILVMSVMSSCAQNRGETIKGFVKDIPALVAENISSIDGLAEASTKKASKTIDLTKDNIADALKQAEGKTCIIVVGSHTFVKFSDTKKCNSSSSWGACMPYGEGYVAKNGLTSVNDYINNIIGKPDTQKRTMFIF